MGAFTALLELSFFEVSLLRLSVCQECGRPIEQHGFRGRPKIHCSPKCYKLSKARSAKVRNSFGM